MTSNPGPANAMPETYEEDATATTVADAREPIWQERQQ